MQPRTNFNFVARDFTNHQENHKENHQDFPLREFKILMEKIMMFTEEIKIFIEKITNDEEITQIPASGSLNPQ